MSATIPLVDLARWRRGDDAERAALAGQVDAACREIGFLLIGNHGVEAADREAIRAAARQFFALPGEAKVAYTTTVGGRGWIPPGKEANSYYGVDADAANRTSRRRGRWAGTSGPVTRRSMPSGSRPTSGRRRCLGCRHSASGTRPRAGAFSRS